MYKKFLGNAPLAEALQIPRVRIRGSVAASDTKSERINRSGETSPPASDVA